MGRYQFSLCCRAHVFCMLSSRRPFWRTQFRDGCDYTADRARRNETFSFPCARKSGFFGSGIVRLGYDRTITFIFITNREPPNGATNSCKARIILLVVYKKWTRGSVTQAEWRFSIFPMKELWMTIWRKMICTHPLPIFSFVHNPGIFQEMNSKAVSLPGQKAWQHLKRGLP